MATSSMLRSVHVKNASQCRKLVSALERAEEVRVKHPAPEKEARNLTKEQIQSIFGNAQK